MLSANNTAIYDIYNIITLMITKRVTEGREITTLVIANEKLDSYQSHTKLESELLRLPRFQES